MKTRQTLGLLAPATFAVAVGFGQMAGPANPPRLKRADSFLGIHFDFHAGPDCTEVGKYTTPEMIERIIDLVGPDYLQIDCKGHPGFASYPTRLGNAVPGFVGDPLRVWREVTARRGVALYLHYSGVWDGEAVKRTGWAAIDAAGQPSTRAISFWGPYADQLLVPQLRELAGDYGVDGMWIDGDCWAAVPDYGDAATKAWREATGFAEVPRQPSEPHWHEWLAFHRDAYRRYLNHTIAEVKRTHPAFQICSNWAFTDHMPEPVCAPVDFLSGDYASDNGVNSARLAGRFLPRQGKRWDLMAWSFSLKAMEQKPAPGQPPPRGQKTAVQLQREAAVVLALGGGFQAYFRQKRDGSIYEEEMPVMAEVARFCRERQHLLHHAEAVPHIALLFSTAAHYRMINGLFNRANARIGGVLQALLDGQHSVEITAEHHLAGRMAAYPLIIVPEWEYLEPGFRGQLSAYVRGGGNLLLIGADAAQLFGDALGTAPALPAQETSSPAVQFASLGRGKVAAIYGPLGAAYTKEPNPATRDLLTSVVRQLVPAPLVEVTGSHDVDVCVARNHGQLLVNLVNTAGPHRTEPILDSIPAVGPLRVAIRVATKPKNVALQPGNRPLTHSYRDGQISLTVPPVAIHDIIAVTP
jgi:hypothetical protein